METLARYSFLQLRYYLLVRKCAIFSLSPHSCFRWNRRHLHLQHITIGSDTHKHVSTCVINTWKIFSKKSLLNRKLPTASSPVKYYSNDSGNLIINNVKVQTYLNNILAKYIKFQTELVSGTYKSESVKSTVLKKMTEMKPVMTALEAYNQTEKELNELKNIGDGLSEADRKEMESMIAEDVIKLTVELEILADNVMSSLLPPERADHNDVILEVAAGVGGGEAFLFTEEIFEMYTNFASYHGWGCEIITADRVDGMGGLRKASASISGEEVYRTLKYESGVHRVQRVPKTEKQGRIHTSTITVAIIPQPTEIDIKINPKDVKVDTYKAQGAGGQHVNTTDSAVRIKHLPTGLVVECQAGRSQIKNRSTAMNMLRTRLYQKELDEQIEASRQSRKIQVGTSGRSEKIRTYNYKQDRITDHRLPGNMFNIDMFLSGGEMLADTIDQLHEEAFTEQLLELIEQKDTER